MLRRALPVLVCAAILDVSTVMAATFTVSTTADSGPGSFRQAILDANATPGLDTIRFSIGGGGPQVIRFTGIIPGITDAVVIDGTTQPGFSGAPIITLDGDDNIGTHLRIASAAPTTIRSLVIIDFLGTAINVDSGGAVITGNYIGVDASGSVADGNNGGINVSENVDGVIIRGNVISANRGNGIEFSGTAGVAASDNNVVQGNIIGLDAQGMNDLGNGLNGIAVDGGNNNQIGGSGSGEGNVISGNGGFGIRISSRGATITGAVGNTIQGNRIGTNRSGTAAVGNGHDGVALFGPHQTTVGGSATGARNLISGNGASGVLLSGDSTVDRVAANTTISGNFIGTDITGSGSLGNAQYGVAISGGADTMLGGTANGAGNSIRFNGLDGVLLFSGVGNSFLGNSIDQNGELGIDLFPSGVTLNDPADGDGGRNNLQNYPELTAVTVTASTRVTGTLNSTPGRTFRVEFFNSPAADPSGFGEGRTLVGFTNVVTNASGDATFTATLAPVTPGTVVSATATDLTTNDTSEFSNAVAAVFVPPVLNVSDSVIVETNSGTRNAEVVVTLSEAAPDDVTFQFSTSDGTATAPADYVTTTGTRTIPAGATTTTITVPVVGDTLLEADETFFVNITNVTGATGGDVQAQVTITNDDVMPMAVPTLSEWLLGVLSALLGLAGITAVRKS